MKKNLNLIILSEAAAAGGRSREVKFRYWLTRDPSTALPSLRVGNCAQDDSAKVVYAVLSERDRFLS